MPDVFSKTISNTLPELQTALLEVSTFLEGKLSPKAVFAAGLALEEMITNTLKYGYDDQAPHQIALRLEINAASALITITDDGRAFNPLLAPPPDTAKPMEERPIGGLGLHLVRGLVDSIDYQRLEGKNVLQIKV